MDSVRRLAFFALLLAACSSENAVAPALTPGADTGVKVADAKPDTATAPDSAALDAVVDETMADGSSDALADASDAGCPSCVGAPFPTWQLKDFQPKSARFGQTYGLEAFKGKVTVVALLTAS